MPTFLEKAQGKRSTASDLFPQHTGEVELSAKPSTKGDKRDGQGRFLPGTKGGSGNPYSKTINKLRGVLLQAVTEADMRDVVTALVDKAKSGDTMAIKILLDRVFGPSVAGDLFSRIEQLEKTITKG